MRDILYTLICQELMTVVTKRILLALKFRYDVIYYKVKDNVQSSALEPADNVLRKFTKVLFQNLDRSIKCQTWADKP